MSLLSGAGMTVCMIGLAVYLQVVPNGSETALSNRGLSSIPLALLLAYVVRTASSRSEHDAPTQMNKTKLHGKNYEPQVFGMSRVQLSVGTPAVLTEITRSFLSNRCCYSFYN
jgi:hypothetical protein